MAKKTCSSKTSTKKSIQIPKVFISHASNDLWVASQINLHIQECGAETFIDVNKIEYGDKFDEIIIEEANNSTELLILFTPKSLDRKYIWMEIGMFASHKKRITVVLYDVTKEQIASDPSIPVLIKGIKSVEINDINSYFEQFKDRVKSGRNLNE